MCPSLISFSKNALATSSAIKDDEPREAVFSLNALENRDCYFPSLKQAGRDHNLGARGCLSNSLKRGTSYLL